MRQLPHTSTAYSCQDNMTTDSTKNKVVASFVYINMPICNSCFLLPSYGLLAKPKLTLKGRIQESCHIPSSWASLGVNSHRTGWKGTLGEMNYYMSWNRLQICHGLKILLRGKVLSQWIHTNGQEGKGIWGTCGWETTSLHVKGRSKNLSDREYLTVSSNITCWNVSLVPVLEDSSCPCPDGLYGEPCTGQGWQRGRVTTDTTLLDLKLRLFLCVPAAEPVTEGTWKARTAEAKRQSNWYCSSCTTLEAPPPPPRRQQGAVWKVMARTCWRSFVRWQEAKAMRWKTRTVRLKSVWMQQRVKKKSTGCIK